MRLRAKFTPPAPFGLLSRPGLMALLCRKENPPITWIYGPPGAGKTYAALDFLTHRSGRTVWYQLDDGDGDPALLCDGLADALKKARRGRRPSLPSFAASLNSEPTKLARLFFERFFEQLGPDGTLVLDDFQELPADSPGAAFQREGFERVPEGVRVLILSREAPPSSLVRLQARGWMNSLGWDELRMNEDEAQALLRSRLPQEFSEGRIQEICRMADGWPAGLSLMAVENGSGMPRANGGIGRERLFDFFASEILGQIRPMTRELLLQMSVFPRFTPRQAQALTGLTSAETELKRLAGSGHFTMARPGVEPVYEFHPLFRDFLRRQAVETRSRRAWCALQERAGMSLAEDGQLYEAFDCYREAGAVERQVALLKAHVMPFLAKGQHHTVQAWINSLPASRIEEDPWILVWKGISGIPTDPKGSFACLEKAFHSFGRVGESAGQMAAWSAVVESRHYGWDEYASLDSWIHWMDQHEKAFEALDETPIREAVTVSMVWALLRRFPTHPRMEQWVKRCERTMKESLQPQVRMQAGMGAFMYRFWGGEQTACEALAQEARLQAASLQEPMARLCSYWIEAGMLVWNRVQPERGRTLIRQGLEEGERLGIHLFDFMFHGHDATLALGDRDIVRAQGALLSMAQRLDGHQAKAFFHYLSGWEAFLDGRRAEALAHVKRAAHLGEALGMPVVEAMNLTALADMLHETGQPEEARQQSDRVEAMIHRTGSPVLEMLHRLSRARRGLQVNPEDPDALAELARALELGRRHGFVNHLWYVSEWTRLICVHALRQGIEVPLVREWIRFHRLLPDPAEVCPNWPWEFQIHTLGAFSIQRDGRPLPMPAKAPWKVLALLKAIVAAGPEGIGERQLVDWLWPAGEGDGGQQSLETGLHRLRKLLGVGEAVLLREGRVMLDPQRCWVDAHCFERALNHPDLQELAFDLYQGDFLKEMEEPWAWAYRDKLKGQYLHLVRMRGQHLESMGDLEKAVGLYTRALEMDPSAESLYQRLMICHQKRGERAEGLRAYQRCCGALQNLLETEPSPQTQRLASTLRD